MLSKGNTCRLCLKECCKGAQCFDNDNSFQDAVLQCFSYQISNDENYPKSICYICTTKLQEALSFKQMIKDNEKILKKYLMSENDIANNSQTIPNLKTEMEWNIERDLVPIKLEKEIDTNQSKIDNEGNIAVSSSLNELKYEKNNEVSAVTNAPMSNMIDFKNIGSDPASNPCLMCSKEFPTKKLLLKHYLTEENEKYVKLMSYIDVDGQTNTKIVNGNIVYVCKECKKEFLSKNQMKKHLILHGKEWPFSCKLCGRMYVKAVELVNHGKSHSAKKFACSYKCGYSSGYEHVVKNHEIRHKSKKKYTCEDCGKSFHVKTWFEQHQNVHKGVKQFACKICGASFYMERYLTRHTSTLHPDAQTVKRYNCINCCKIFNNKHALNLHLQEHGIKKEYLCDICGKVMKNASHLKLHRRIHANDRPYVCGICNKSFTKKFNLKVHQNIHTNEKHECLICTKTYTQKSSLKRHEARKHAKEDK